MNKGYIKLHRKIKDHWVFKKPEYFKAWIDIILTVNYQDSKVVIGNQLMMCKRGESLFSIKSWAQRWNWSYSKVRNFFYLLQKDNMIQIANEKVTTRLTVVNYDSYQDIVKANENEIKSKKKANEKQPKTTKVNINKNNKYYTMEFDEFWKEYPRKIAKADAFKKWLNLKPELAIVLESLKKYKNTQQWQDVKYIPHAATWLNQKRWEDEIDLDETRKVDVINQVVRTPIIKSEPEEELSDEELRLIEIEKQKMRNSLRNLNNNFNINK